MMMMSLFFLLFVVLLCGVVVIVGSVVCGIETMNTKTSHRNAWQKTLFLLSAKM